MAQLAAEGGLGHFAEDDPDGETGRGQKRRVRRIARPSARANSAVRHR